MSQQVPKGFKPFLALGGFIDDCGPFYYAKRGEGDYRYGFMAEQRHGNIDGVIHGGVLVAFADTFMGRVVIHAAKCPCATISLNTEFVAGAKPDNWVEGWARIVRLTKALAFVQSELVVGDETVMTASGVWRVFRNREIVLPATAGKASRGGK